MFFVAPVPSCPIPIYITSICLHNRSMIVQIFTSSYGEFRKAIRIHYRGSVG